MNKSELFREEITKGYSFEGESMLLGTAMLDREPVLQLPVRMPLKTFNRHGLIAGATGTGKTKSLQVLSEGLSDAGVPVLLMDIKGDLSGLSQPGKPHRKIDERHHYIGTPWQPLAYPVELLSISEAEGIKLRATVSEFGPVLLGKILELNDTQSGVVSLVFKYCDDHQLPLLDLKDFRIALRYLSNEGKSEIQKEYGRISSASVGAILRKVVEIEEQGADLFFGEPSFEVNDLLQTREGKGVINILRLMDVQGRPKMFSTFMLCLLAEVYELFPEQGDKETPELVIFIDEAHLIFKEASKALLSQIETIIKLIRSKGVGIIFVTQSPADVPQEVLGQLGLKIQHALRAFTARDRKAIKLAAENYPLTEYYKTAEELTSLGIGEALITVLNEDGVPTPLARTLLRAPFSRMDIISQKEFQQLLRGSLLKQKYNQTIDRESAYEKLSRKLEQAADQQGSDVIPQKSKKSKTEPTFLDTLSKNTMVRQMGRTLIRELSRGLLGVLGNGSKRR
ncbi:MAG: ATPase [Cyclobacteriaceae bacterium]|nr:MAG: ATPase [Cyclobacteriaceae bacterium]